MNPDRVKQLLTWESTSTTSLLKLMSGGGLLPGPLLSLKKHKIEPSAYTGGVKSQYHLHLELLFTGV